jgi:hypothetical protein
MASHVIDGKSIVEAMDRSSDSLPSDSGVSVTCRLLRIWRSALQRPDLGVDENFFDAGGTSLKAVRVVARIRKEFSTNLTLVTLFECATVRRLAARLAPSNASEHRDEGALNRGLQRRRRVGARTR